MSYVRPKLRGSFHSIPPFHYQSPLVENVPFGFLWPGIFVVQHAVSTLFYQSGVTLMFQVELEPDTSYSAHLPVTFTQLAKDLESE